MNNSKALINRLNRAIGQMEAIKKRLSSTDEQDCVETLRQVKTVQSALKKFAEAYVKQQVQSCLEKKQQNANFQQELEEVITSAFNL